MLVAVPGYTCVIAFQFTGISTAWLVCFELAVSILISYALHGVFSVVVA